MDSEKEKNIWGLDWDNGCWMGGNYYGSDEFETAVKTFFELEGE